MTRTYAPIMRGKHPYTTLFPMVEEAMLAKMLRERDNLLRGLRDHIRLRWDNPEFLAWDMQVIIDAAWDLVKQEFGGVQIDDPIARELYEKRLNAIGKTLQDEKNRVRMRVSELLCA